MLRNRYIRLCLQTSVDRHIFVIAVAGGIFFLGRVTTPKPQPQTPIATSSPQSSPIPSLTTDKTTNLRTYSTTGVFGLTEEILQEYPSISKGNFKFSYPSNWKIYISKPNFSNQKRYGVFLGIQLNKDHPDYTSLGEIPSENSAFIDFRIKVTNLSPDQLVSNYSEEFGKGSFDDKAILQQTFNGYRAAKIVGNQPFPRALVFSISPTTVMNIDIDFYDNGRDQIYSNKTLNEINEILNSVMIIQ